MRHLVKRIRLFREMFEHETQSRGAEQSKRLRFNFRKGIRDKFDIAGKLIVQQLIISKGDSGASVRLVPFSGNSCKWARNRRINATQKNHN